MYEAQKILPLTYVLASDGWKFFQKRGDLLIILKPVFQISQDVSRIWAATPVSQMIIDPQSVFHKTD